MASAGADDIPNWNSKLEPPRMFLSLDLLSEYRIQHVPSDPFMSHLDAQLGFQQGRFNLWDWLSLWRLVSWIYHLPPECWSTFWKSTFEQQSYACISVKRVKRKNNLYKYCLCPKQYIYIKIIVLYNTIMHVYCNLWRMKGIFITMTS